ncbi:transcription termination factor NusA [Patescibacteria group bacterium]|nr:transcription termination factor NusA [Patescibacteria group bacterium]
METTILSAIQQICEEKNLSAEQVLGAIEQALAAAFRKDFGEKNQNIKVEFNPESKKMKVFDVKTVVEDLPEEDEEEKGEEKEEKEERRRFNPRSEIQISEAKLLSPQEHEMPSRSKLKVGDIIRTPLEAPSEFGRIAAQTAKQVITQRLREAEREIIFEKYQEKEGTIINGTIQRKEKYAIFVDLGDTTAILPTQQQIREERYSLEQKIKVFVLSVDQGPKGPEIIVSRRHPNILRNLFETEIPEIANGTVEIKAIAREPGSRTKIAVWSDEKNLDPIGSCVGQRGIRIQTIINECGGEKIDIIKYSEDPKEFITNALSPAKIYSIDLDEKEGNALVKVKKDQLSLAIGKAGQNVRLAARLSGWKINIQEHIEEDEEEKGEEKEKGKNEEEKVEEKKTLEKKIKKDDQEEKEKKKSTKKAKKSTKSKK